MPVEIGPSILTADWLRLGDEIAAAERAGVDFFHLDVMDGHFVPNITFGFEAIRAIRSATTLPLDVHLMIERPDRYVERFAAAGADRITVHVEACEQLAGTLKAVEGAGAMPGVTLNPMTALESVTPVIPMVEQVLVMGVNPGFGGQALMPSALNRLRQLRQEVERLNPACHLSIDGGIKASNIAEAVEAGADRVVVGSAIYNQEMEVAEAVEELRRSVA